jgi:putative heme-binding domain-containing protein
MWAARICTLVLAGGALLFSQQRINTAEDSEAGGRLFQGNCARCHGPDGDAVPGIDLGHGKFRRASTDADLIKIIQNGIPGTAMPPNNFPETQAATIVTYMRSMAASSRSTSASGDAARGKAVFDGKGGCLNCHRDRGNGSRVGPELTDIGSQRRAADLERSLLDPDAEVLPQNRYVRATTRDGAAVTGRILNQDAFTVQLLDSKERLVSLAKSDLREFVFDDKSPMPSYQGKLSPQELTDLVSYLVSLKGIEKQ